MPPIESLADLKAKSESIAKPAESATAPAAAAAPAKTETPPATTEKPAEAASAPAAAAQAPAAEGATTPPWQPNFKLKVMDEEREIPESFRALIKDATSEKEVHEIFKLAYGLEHAKPKHEARLVELTNLQKQHGEVTARMQNWEQNERALRNAASSGPDSKDFERFLAFWKISDETLYKYAQRKLEYQEQLAAMDPATRAQVERAQQEEARARQVQAQNQQLQQVNLQQALQMRLAEVDRTVSSRPDIAEVANQYCAGKKDPNAFKRLVQSVATQAYYTTGKDLSVEEAIREAMSLMGYEEVDAPAGGGQAAPASGQAPGQAPAAQPPAPVVAPVTQKKLPVIPSVGSGSGAAPVKKAVGSIAELRERRAALQQQQ